MILKHRIFINSIVCSTLAAVEEHYEWSKTDDFNSQLQEVCQRNGWNYVDISDITNPDEDTYYQEDVIHYIQDLYPVWAERMIGETIKVNGEKDEDPSFFFCRVLYGVLYFYRKMYIILHSC